MNDDQLPPAIPDATPVSPSQTISKEEQNWAMGAHLSALAILFGIPFVNLVGPIVVWQTKKDTMPFAAQEAKESLNFQISMMIYLLLAGLSLLILIGFVLLPALLVANVIFVIIAGIAAGEGKPYRYPFTIRFIS